MENLTVEFLTDVGWSTVVEDVSFHVGAGETLGIVGESGSGKTVTSMAVMGLVPQPPGRIRSGQIRLEGMDLLGLSSKQLEDVRGDRVSMIFQEPMTSPESGVHGGGSDRRDDAPPPRVCRARSPRARAVDMLSRVHIPNAARRAKAYPHEFSGGMRQRVMIAMALCCEPTLLIADEPTTALDVTVQAQVLALIREIQADMGMSILFITHDLGVVADVCDRVVVMYAGQVVEHAPADELFHTPSHPYTDGLLKSMPAMAARTGQLHSIDGHPPMVGAMPTGCRFHPRCVHAIDACKQGDSGSIPLIQVTPTQDSRCIRVGELDLGATIEIELETPIDAPVVFDPSTLHTIDTDTTEVTS